jgi:2-polyprenyl-3-methyl-5-hydroxy-6-metoxy-1,4-benzoquinol methylase
MVCLVCKSEKNEYLSNIKGLDGLDYGIYNCLNCGSNFTKVPDNISETYNKVYIQDDFSSGYDKYFQIFQGIKKAKKPLDFLLDQQPLYLPIMNFIKKRKNLKILEIGCGLGYLTYALNQSGYEARGIDISEKSIALAKKEFGDHYENSTIERLSGGADKYDLIIATELIEHLDQPSIFLDRCRELLADNGAIIITTPNKDYYGKKYLWNTELPPLHLSWLGISGLERIISDKKFNYKFFNYLRNGVAFREKTNLLTDWFVSRNISYRDFYPAKSGNDGKQEKVYLLKRVFVDCYVIRLICNLFYSVCFVTDLRKYVIVSMILTKN